MTALVSIILPVLNGGAWLDLAVASILHQTYQKWELLIIDDGSTDGAPQRVAGILDPRVNVIIDGENRGLAKRLNEGVAMAKGELIARMDADDISFPDRIIQQVYFLQNNPEIDLLGTSGVIFNEQGKSVCMLRIRIKHQDLVAQPWRGIPIPHPTWMGRREWFQRYRYRNPEVRRAEDQELLLRAYPDSQFACLDEPLFGYRQGQFNYRTRWIERRYLLASQVEIFWVRKEYLNLALATLFTGLKLIAYSFAAVGIGRHYSSSQEAGDDTVNRFYEALKSAKTLSIT